MVAGGDATYVEGVAHRPLSQPMREAASHLVDERRGWARRALALARASHPYRSGVARRRCFFDDPPIVSA
jgi:hypothetical protein